MARHIAKNIVAARLADECTVSIAYAIGKAEPLAVTVDTHGSSSIYDDSIIAQAVKAVFDLTPAGIIRMFGLQKPIYSRTSNYGHFGKNDLPWEAISRAFELRVVCDAIIKEQRKG